MKPCIQHRDNQSRRIARTLGQGPRLRALALLLAVVVFSFSCTPDRHDPSAGPVLRMGNGGEPKSLDPHIVTGVIEDRILSALFEGLVNLDLETLTPIPGAAESWTTSADGTVYTFHLQPHGRWSNGDPVTAHDFAYAWRRVLTPSLAAEYAYMLYPILNAEDYHAGRLDDFSEVGVKALDGRTLQVTLRAPTPYFLSMQVHYTWFPVHQPSIEAHGPMDQRGGPWTRPGNLVGNGPFVLTEWIPNDRIAVTKNPRYWDADSVSLQSILYVPIANANVEERAFRAGDLHVTYTLPLTRIPAYQRDNPHLIRVDPYLAVEFIRFNTNRPPFDDLNVRRAFALAIDRETLAQNVLRAGQQPAAHFVPPGIGDYVSNGAVWHDPEAARRSLELAGYPNGSGFPNVELIYDTGDNQRIYAETLQNMWKQTLGVTVNLVNLDTKTWLANMIALDYQVARSYWLGDYVDPSNFLEMFYTNSGNNRTGFTSHHYEALLREAATTLDGPQRNALYQQAEDLLLAQLPIAPVYFHTRPFLKSPELHGLTPNILGRVHFKNLSFDPAL